MAIATITGRKLGLTLTGLMCCSPALAGEWTLTPSVTLAETYTDNVQANAPVKTDSWVTEVAPQMVLSGEGRHSRGSLIYSINNFSYSHDSELNDTYDMYNGVFDVDLWRDQLTLSLTGQKGQYVNSLFDSATPLDRVSNPGESFDVETYAGTLAFNSHVGRWMNVSISAQRNKVAAGRQLGSSSGNRLNVQLNSGTRFKRTYWQVYGQLREFDRDHHISLDDPFYDQRFSTLSGEMGVGLVDTLSLYVKYFDQENRFQGSLDQERDSAHWGPGLSWAPSRRTEARLSYNFALDDNNDDFVGFDYRWSPSRRTNVQLALGKRYYGNYYDVSIRQSGKHWRFNGGYKESTSHFRIQLFDEPLTGNFICPIGTESDFSQCSLSPNIVPELAPDQTLLPIDQVIPQFVESPQLDKRYFLSTSITGGRTTLQLDANNTRRTNLLTNTTYEQRFFKTSINYSIGALSNVQLSGSYREFTQDIALPSQGSSQDRTYQLLFLRQLNHNMSISTSISHTHRNGQGGVDDYEENRFNLSFTKEF